MIWPESAIPYALLQEPAARDFVSQKVADWGVPLLTGAMDKYAVSEANRHLPQGQPKGALKGQKEESQYFNAALVLTPNKEHGMSSSASVFSKTPVYHKQVLMPFAERVPFSDRFPQLQHLAINLGVGGTYGVGGEAIVLSFRDRQGREVNLASPICYEQLYPAKVAEMVRGGAQMLALLTNEGWFAQTHGAYQLAAFTRLRAIETRRVIARTANTGLTCLIDEFGRIYSQAPWWEEQTLAGRVKLSDEQSLYVRYTDYFPRACLWLALIFVTAALIK